MISDEYFANLYNSLSDDVEQFSLSLLERIRRIAITLSGGGEVDPDRQAQIIANLWGGFNETAKEWTDQNLPKAYKKGISIVDGDFPEKTIASGSFITAGMFGSGGGATIPPSVREALSGLHPRYLTMYEVFQEQAYEGFQATRVPVIRDTMDTIRELTIQASDEAYRTADTLTRRQLSQDIANDLANRGITGVRYKNGRRMGLDAYAEMVARTQTGNASRQAAINRTQEYGQDLVLISSHYPVSPLCEPWQGRVYSLSGDSNKYPPLDRAISGGLYHSNCKHSQSGYTDGQRIPEAREKVDTRENERRYELQNQQRYNERQIRTWKRRKAVALTDEERKRAQNYISKWQAKQRELIDGEDWMRRQYGREAI